MDEYKNFIYAILIVVFLIYLVVKKKTFSLNYKLFITQSVHMNT